jgi:small subunit ribosomal protein S2
MAPVVTMRQLLESGVHFGHQTRRWNPKMKRFIFTERNGIYIIDLQQSLEFIDRAYEFIKETVAHGGTVLYVGTKKQAQEAIAEQARRVGMPFVNQRWLGGMLTNFSTVYKRLQRLKELEEMDFDDASNSGLTKKELLHLRRERDKLDRSLGGIRDMSRVPSAVWVVDTKKEHIAVSEARKLGIPVVAILDTNCDPDEVTYPIPGNDDAIRSVALLTRVVADAVADGLIARAGAAAGEEKPAVPGADGVLGTEEPLAEWERDLLERSAAAGGSAEAAAAGQAGTGDGAAGTGAPSAATSGSSSGSHNGDGASRAGAAGRSGAPAGSRAATADSGEPAAGSAEPAARATAAGTGAAETGEPQAASGPGTGAAEAGEPQAGSGPGTGAAEAGEPQAAPNVAPDGAADRSESAEPAAGQHGSAGDAGSEEQESAT